MSLLPIVPVVLLVLVAVWFFWPVVIDPIERLFANRRLDDADQVAEHLFDRWSEDAHSTGAMAGAGRG